MSERHYFVSAVVVFKFYNIIKSVAVVAIIVNKWRGYELEVNARLSFF